LLSEKQIPLKFHGNLETSAKTNYTERPFKAELLPLSMQEEGRTVLMSLEKLVR
jgi:hypothetical protein